MSTNKKHKKQKYAKSTPKSSWHDRTDAQEYVKKLVIQDNVYPRVLKLRQGWKMLYQPKYGAVANRINRNPSAETEYVDNITVEDMTVAEDEFDFEDTKQLEAYKRKMKDIEERDEVIAERVKMHGDMLKNLSGSVHARLMSKYGEAVTSKYTTTPIFINMILSSVYTGDITAHRREIRRKLNEYAQSPDETDKSYVDRGRHLIEEAEALQVNHEEKELVDVAMRGLNGAWSVVKNQYVLNYDPDDPNVTTFDDVERHLEQRVAVKLKSAEASLYVEANLDVTNRKGNKPGKKEPSKKKEEKPSDKKKGAVVNPTTRKCFLCDEEHKAADCKYLDVCRVVVQTIKKKAEAKKEDKLQKTVAAITEKDDGAEDDFITGIKNMFPVLVEESYVLAAVRDEAWVIFDTGAAINLFSDNFGYEVSDAPEVVIATVGSSRRLNKAFIHPIFGMCYYDPEKHINVVAASKILQDADRYRVRIKQDGNFEVLSLQGDESSGYASFETCWRKGVMMFDHSQIQYLDSN